MGKMSSEGGIQIIRLQAHPQLPWGHGTWGRGDSTGVLGSGRSKKLTVRLTGRLPNKAICELHDFVPLKSLLGNAVPVLSGYTYI